MLVLQITDSHILKNKNDFFCGIDPRKNLHRVLTKARKINPDLLVLTGDLSQDGTKESYQFIADEIANLNCQKIWLPGNHDNIEVAETILGAQIKDLLLNNWYMIFLNTYYKDHESGLLDAKELDFLKKALTKQVENTIIFLHHHVLSVESPWLDAIRLENHAEFIDIIKQYSQIKIVACGHIHQNFFAKQGGIVFVGTPATSIQFKPHTQQLEFDDLQPGFRWFELQEDGKFNTDVVRVTSI